VTVTSPETKRAQGLREAPPVRAHDEQANVSDALLRSLIRAQLGLAIRLLAVFGTLLLGLPLLFALAPGLGAWKVFGIDLPWIVLGVTIYPLLVLLGLLYVRIAERNEREFAELVAGLRLDEPEAEIKTAPEGP
jgi:hypothetical protein